MAQRIFPRTLSLLALVAAASMAPAQEYPCSASGGVNCRELIPDHSAPTSHMDSVITIVPEGACLSMPVGRVALDLNVLHNWENEVGIQLINPDSVTATVRVGVRSSGINYPNDDLSSFNVVPALVGGGAAGSWTLRLNDVDGSAYGALDDWTLYLVCGQVPEVTITAPDPTAIENPIDTGVFRVTRSVVTSTPLDVNLLFSGTAGPTDYAPLPAIVTIPANLASVDLVVTPVADAAAEAAETVIAMVAEGGLYATGTPSTAVVTIYDTVTGIPTLDRFGVAILLVLLAMAGVALLRSRSA